MGVGTGVGVDVGVGSGVLVGVGDGTVVGVGVGVLVGVGVGVPPPEIKARSWAILLTSGVPMPLAKS